MTTILTELTPRQIDVLILIGRDDLSYSKAASMLRNRNLRRLDHSDVPHISPRTVQKYANEVRDLIGSADVPTRALRAFYWENREEVEDFVAVVRESEERVP